MTAVANNGTVYDLTLVDKTTDANGKLIKDYEAAVDHTIDGISQTTWDAIHTGHGTGSRQAQRHLTGSISLWPGKPVLHSTIVSTLTMSFYVGYAPAESPQISIAVRITYGYNSGYSAEIGRDIARVYFNRDAAQEVVTGSAADLGTGIAGD